MNRIVLIICLIFSAQSGYSQLQKGQINPAKIPALSQHYLPEYTYDVSANPELWSNQKPGLNVSFASTDELYLRTEAPTLPAEKHTMESTGWRGERRNAQVLVWSTDTLEQVRFSVSDLVNAKQQKLSKSNVKIQMVRYVLSNFAYGAMAQEC